MNELKNPSSGIGLGIAGLILGILSIPFGILGCTFMLALLMGILGITLSAVGLSQARQANSSTGLIIAALIISIIGTSFAIIRLTNSAKKTKNIFWEWDKDWKNKLEELDDDDDTGDYSSTFEDAFRKGFKDEVEIDVEINTGDLEEELEQLERELERAGDEVERSLEKMSDAEKVEKLGRATGKAVRGFIKELNDSVEE